MPILVAVLDLPFTFSRTDKHTILVSCLFFASARLLSAVSVLVR